MNIWEYGKKQAENSKEELSKKQFGIEHWYALLDTHELYFVEFDQAVQDLIVPMGWLHSGPRDKYEIMQKQFNLVMSYEDYQLHCKLIHDTLVDYDYKMFRLIDDPLFKLKEFGQLALLNQEIYQNGSFNYPSFRWMGGLIRVHPGQHLNYSQRFLGHPIKAWFTVPKTNDHYDAKQFFQMYAKHAERITDDRRVIDILNTRHIAASVQYYSNDVKTPSFYPSIPRPIWSDYDTNGNTNWPWKKAETFAEHLKQSKHFDLLMKVVHHEQPLDLIHQVAEVRPHDREVTLINNFVTFLTTEQQSDYNFKLK